LLARQPWASLRPLIPGDAPEVEVRLAALRDYTRQLLDWNRGVSNLISRHDEPRIVERHLFESIFPARAIAGSGCSTFVDFGSGAGLPAVPLFLCGVGERWTLVESRRNKTLFIRKVQQDTKLSNFVVKTARLEVLVAEGASGLQCDGFTSRATTALGPTLELAAAIVTPGGRAFLWKGSGYTQEMETARASWEQSWSFEQAITIGEGPSVVAVFVKT
jgi:16S rRNA (guanine527-N7)-methyltransferase